MPVTVKGIRTECDTFLFYSLIKFFFLNEMSINKLFIRNLQMFICPVFGKQKLFFGNYFSSIFFIQFPFAQSFGFFFWQCANKSFFAKELVVL